MIRLMKTEWKKFRIPILLTIVLDTTVMAILCCTLYQSYAMEYALEAWEIGTEIFDFAFPLLVVVPLCWSLYYERKDHFLLYAGARTPLEVYLKSKWCVQAASAFAILFIPYFVSALITLKTVSFEQAVYNLASFRHVFQTAFMETPVLYALVLSAWKGLIGILVMSMGFVLSLYVNNVFIILTGPFVYYVLENFVFSILRIEQYRLVTAFSPASLDPRAITPGSFLVGPLMLLLVTFLIWFILNKVKKLSVLEV